uniref:NAD(+) kinase n=1 Tax=Arion vulgaris TaxID=1028688 RepID=A0A0B7A5Y3_9EUPU
MISAQCFSMPSGDDSSNCSSLCDENSDDIINNNRKRDFKETSIHVCAKNEVCDNGNCMKCVNFGDVLQCSCDITQTSRTISLSSESDINSYNNVDSKNSITLSDDVQEINQLSDTSFVSSPFLIEVSTTSEFTLPMFEIPAQFHIADGKVHSSWMWPDFLGNQALNGHYVPAMAQDADTSALSRKLIVPETEQSLSNRHYTSSAAQNAETNALTRKVIDVATKQSSSNTLSRDVIPDNKEIVWRNTKVISIERETVESKFNALEVGDSFIYDSKLQETGAILRHHHIKNSSEQAHCSRNNIGASSCDLWEIPTGSVADNHINAASLELGRPELVLPTGNVADNILKAASFELGRPEPVQLHHLEQDYATTTLPPAPQPTLHPTPSDYIQPPSLPSLSLSSPTVSPTTELQQRNSRIIDNNPASDHHITLPKDNEIPASDQITQAGSKTSKDIASPKSEASKRNFEASMSDAEAEDEETELLWEDMERFRGRASNVEVNDDVWIKHATAYKRTYVTIPDPSNQKLNWTKPPLTVLIIRKHLDESVLLPFKDLVIWLMEKKNMVIYVEEMVLGERILLEDEEFQRIQDKLISFKEGVDDLTDKIDFIICLGGDGTLLYVSSLFQDSVPPVMAFNMGSLGFLTPFQFYQDFKHEVTRVMQGSASLLLRFRLKCVVVKQDTANMTEIPHVKNIQKDDASLKTHKLVLNEVVVDRGSSSYLSNLDLYIEGRRVTTVQGDGLIISTPTGSTAYAVAAGASMIHPSVPCILLTPICPHSLSFRPIVVPAGVEIKVMLSPGSRGTAMVSFDGRDRKELHQGDSLRITTASYPVPSICAADQIEDWFDGLAVCLNWNLRLQQRPLQCSSSLTSIDSLDSESSSSNLYSQMNGVAEKPGNFQ